MARKKLLSEGEIRQFMKLANLRPLGQERLSEYAPGDRDLEDPGMAPAAGDLPPDPAAADAGPDADAEPLEMEMEMEPEGEGGAKQAAAVSLLRAVEEWAGEHGIEMDIEETGEDVMDEPVELEADVVDDPAELEEVPAGVEDLAEAGMIDTSSDPAPHRKQGDRPRGLPGGKDDKWHCEEERGGRWVGEKCMKDGEVLFPKDLGGGIDEHAIVAEVARRVAMRLKADSRKEKIADQLAERIMKRLTK